MTSGLLNVDLIGNISLLVRRYELLCFSLERSHTTGDRCMVTPMAYGLSLQRTKHEARTQEWPATAASMHWSGFAYSHEHQKSGIFLYSFVENVIEDSVRNVYRNPPLVQHLEETQLVDVVTC